MIRKHRAFVLAALITIGGNVWAEERRGVRDDDSFITRVIRVLQSIVQPLSDKISPPIG